MARHKFTVGGRSECNSKYVIPARIMPQADSDWLPPGDLDEMRRRSA
jgi:hypothetical protein